MLYALLTIMVCAIYECFISAANCCVTLLILQKESYKFVIATTIVIHLLQLIRPFVHTVPMVEMILKTDSYNVGYGLRFLKYSFEEIHVAVKQRYDRQVAKNQVVFVLQ